MSLVAFAAHERLRGVRAADGDWREPAGSEANKAGIVAAYTVSDLSNALAATYSTDAHLVACVLRLDGVPERFQPRLTKPSLAWLLDQGYAVSAEVLVADLDNEGHAAWASEQAATEAAAAVALELGTVGVYVTAHGLRVLQPLLAPLTPEQGEAATRAWYLELERHGLTPDWSCVDWTRHYRLPHVVRAGARYRSPAVLVDRMRPVAPPAGLAGAARKRGAPSFVGPVRDVDESPLARAFSLVGWAGPRLAADRRAVRCPWEAEHTGGATFDTSTVLFGPSQGKPRGTFHCSHSHCAGRRAQRDVIEALPPDARRLVWSSGAAETPAPAPVEPLDVVSARLTEAIRRAPEGLSLVRAQCGLGKTHAIRQVAAERAATLGKLHTKTSISVPTNALAMQVTSDLRAAGVTVLRVFGPLSVTGSDGRPTCRFHAAGTALARGGQSVRRELCEGRGRPCQHRDDCDAVDGVEGPDDARVVVGSHGLLGELDAETGKTGLLAIDEPPALLEPVVLAVEDLTHAIAELGSFERRYAAAMAPALHAVRWWTELTGPVGEPGPLARAFDLGGVNQDLLTDAFEHTGATDADAAARDAFDEAHRGTAPPLRADESFQARINPARAKALGEASRVLLALWRALNHPEAASVSIEVTTDRCKRAVRRLVVTLVREALERAVRRDGRCVVLAADAELHAPVLAKAVGYDPPVSAFAAPDGAPVQRTVLRTSSANRRGWMPHGRLDVATVARALRGAVDWACESSWSAPIAIVSYPLVEAALAAALGRTSPPWPGTGPERAEALEVLGPVLARLPAPPELGHYGALRGLDHWKALDQLVTLGDPWPDLDAMAREIAFLKLAADRDARAEAHARAELEQAHGRLRLVHRTTPARLLHVGRLVPGGWPAAFEQRDLPLGRPARDAVDVRSMVEALGGATKVSRILGVGRRTVYNWLNGEHTPDPEALEALTRAAVGGGYGTSPSVPRTPGEYIDHQGFSAHFAGTATGVLGTLEVDDVDVEIEGPDSAVHRPDRRGGGCGVAPARNAAGGGALGGHGARATGAGCGDPSDRLDVEPRGGGAQSDLAEREGEGRARGEAQGRGGGEAAGLLGLPGGRHHQRRAGGEGRPEAVEPPDDDGGGTRRRRAPRAPRVAAVARMAEVAARASRPANTSARRGCGDAPANDTGRVLAPLAWREAA